MEDQVVDLLVRQVRIGGDQVVVDGLLAHLLAVDAGAVVGKLDDDAARAVLCREADGAFRVLAEGFALLRHFEAVVDRVADHVRQRLGKLVDDGLVDFGVLAFGDEADRLAGDVGDFADGTGHALEDRLDRLRANRHHRILDLAGELLELLEAHVDGGRAVRVVLDDALREHRLVDDELADEVDQAVDAIEIDADRLACSGRLVRLRGAGGRGGGSGLGVFRGAACNLCDLGGGFGGGDGSRGITFDDSGFVGGSGATVVKHGKVEGNRLHRQLFVTARLTDDVFLDGLDIEVAIPLGEFEDGAHAVLALLGRHRDLPGEIGFLRVHLVERRQGVHVAIDAHLAEAETSRSRRTASLPLA